MKKIIKKKNLQNSYPFGEVKVIMFKINNKTDREELAYAQYKLLLNPQILQAHLDYQTKTGTVIALNSLDIVEESKKLGLDIKLDLIKWVMFEEVLKKNTQSFTNKCFSNNLP